jgi:hypothetical protein
MCSASTQFKTRSLTINLTRPSVYRWSDSNFRSESGRACMNWSISLSLSSIVWAFNTRMELPTVLPCPRVIPSMSPPNGQLEINSSMFATIWEHWNLVFTMSLHPHLSIKIEHRPFIQSTLLVCSVVHSSQTRSMNPPIFLETQFIKFSKSAGFCRLASCWYCPCNHSTFFGDTLPLWSLIDGKSQ